MKLPGFSDVAAARTRLLGLAVQTPLLEHPVLNKVAGGRILLKAENLQYVGAFKFRGAYNKISQIDNARFPGGVVACSSGNHAQGVAAAATICKMPSLIVMPKDAPALKIQRTKSFGAEVVLYDRDHEDRDAIAKKYCADRDAAFVHPYEDYDVIAGQGTVGAELMEQAATIGVVPDAVFVNTSGGGLLSGIAIAVKHHSAATKVHAVEPEGFDDFARSLQSGNRETNKTLSGSICDALLTPSPGAINLAVTRDKVAGALTVTDQEAIAAVRFAYYELKLVLEPGGAASLGAILAGKCDTKNRVTAAVLTGGNIDPEIFSKIICGSSDFN